MQLKSYNLTILYIIVVSTLLYIYFNRFEVYILDTKELFLGLNIITLILALFFDKSKIAILLTIPILFYLYMFFPSLLFLQGGKNSFWSIFPVTLTITFLTISPQIERGIFNLYGFLKIVALIFILSFTYYILHDFNLSFKSFFSKSFLYYKPDFIICNDTTTILTLITLLIVTIFSFLIHKKRVEYAIFWMAFSLMIPVWLFQTKGSFLYYSAITSTIALYTLLKETHEMAYMDTLTKIPSRRALEEDFLKLGKRYSVAMVDIDFFKKFNDTYGHDTGDEVLKLVAKEIQNVKGGGKAYRYGGEEFTILFNNKETKDTLPFLEDVRERIEKRGFIIRDKERPKTKPKTRTNKTKQKRDKRIKITVSIGVASAPKDAIIPYEVIKIADKMLYKAKEKGRNRVVST